MLKTSFIFLATSYFAWYIERFETAVIYPFDATYATPENAGEPRLTEMRFPTGDGEELIVWRSPAQEGKPTLIYLPGNAGGLKDRSQRFSQIIDQGYGLAALAYRGSSGSTGQPEEMLLTDDAVAMVRAQIGTPLVLYGESLGTAVAIKLAAMNIGDAVILEAPFTSISELVSSQYPGEALDHLITQRWESLQQAPSVRQPLLVIHGSDDRVVPIGMGRQIFENAGSKHKRFFEVSNRGHNGLWTLETQRTLFDFLDSL